MGVALNVSLGYGRQKAAEDGLHDQEVHRDAALRVMGIVIHFASRAVASLKFAALLYAISPLDGFWLNAALGCAPANRTDPCRER